MLCSGSLDNNNLMTEKITHKKELVKTVKPLRKKT